MIENNELNLNYLKYSRKVKISINPDPSIKYIASVGDDNYIHLWNYDEK